MKIFKKQNLVLIGVFCLVLVGLGLVFGAKPVSNLITLPILSESQQTLYTNQKYNYSLKFPENWFIKHFGESQETAGTIVLVTNQADLTAGDGGPPRGAKVQIFVQDLGELHEVDSSFPQINFVDDWIDWERLNQQGFDSEAQGEPKDETMTIAKQQAIKTTYSQPMYPEDMGKSIRVTVLSPDKKYIFQIQYVATEPDFSEQESNFENILSSFKFTN